MLLRSRSGDAQSNMTVAVRLYLPSLPFAFLLACLFVPCEPHNNFNSESDDAGRLSNSQPFVRNKRNTNQYDDNALKDPGVIVGIIVGVAGVLVVIGVIILLCRLFCCKESSCCTGCPCCKEEESYLDAGTVPIKVPSQGGPPPGDNSPCPSTTSTVSNHHHHHPSSHNKPSTGDVAEKTLDTAPSLPRYDDVPQWGGHRLNESMDKAQYLESPDLESRQHEEHVEALSANDSRENAKGSFVSGAKRKEKTPTRRKLTYEVDNPDVGGLSLSGNNGEFIALEQEPKKRNVDAPPRHGDREFPSKKNRSLHYQPTRGDDRAETTRMDRNTEERTEGREFPLLEIEPRKRRVPHPDDSFREDAGGFRPVEHAHHPPSHYPTDLRNPMWREDGRRPGWDHREIINAREPREEAGDNHQRSSPMEHAHHPPPPHHTDPRYPRWREEESRRPGWDHREILNARAPIPHSRSNVPDSPVPQSRDYVHDPPVPVRRDYVPPNPPIPHMRGNVPDPPVPHSRSYNTPDHGQFVSFAQDNLAYNQDTTETTV